jgi:hypothetical protein
MKTHTMNYFGWIAVACVAVTAWNVAQAQTVWTGQRAIGQTAQGNVVAGSGGAYRTASGAQGARSARFKRSDDGSVDASRQAKATTANGSTAERSASFTRSADGSSASAERSTTATNANTGVIYDGSTTWTKGSGLSRSGSCKDAAGNTVTCGSAR